MRDSSFIIISENKKEFWKRLIAAISYTIAVWYIFFFIMKIFNYPFYRPSYSIRYYSYYFFIPSLALIRYSNNLIRQRQVVFDLKRNKYRKQNFYGWFSFKNKWQNLPELDYISLFRDRTEGDCEIHLWFKENKRVKLFESNNWAEIFFLAYDISHKLNIELYNSLNANDKHWVNLTIPAIELIDDLEKRYRNI